jgi:hypothetical protein
MTASPTNSVRTRRRLPAALAGLAAVACVACCALPLLLAAGTVSGVGWAVTGRWLPAIGVLSIVAPGVLWWSARRHRHRGGCAGGQGCSCGQT